MGSHWPDQMKDIVYRAGDEETQHPSQSVEFQPRITESVRIVFDGHDPARC